MEIKISTPQEPTLTAIPEVIPSELFIVWEDFPRIGEKISIMWGYVELQNYLGHIILDERGGRQGFPEGILDALIEIYAIHAKVLNIVPSEPIEKE